MPEVDIGGTAIHYALGGPETGPWLVFSNSLGTNLHMWDRQAGRLADRYRILRYDSRGHGRSGAPDGDYSLDRLGRDALALMEALGIERADFCGLSKGGMVGMWLAVNAPARIGRLVLCNTAAHLPPADLWDGRIAAARNRGMASLTETILQRWFTEPYRDANPATLQRIRAMLMATPAHGYAGCCAAIRDMDLRADLPRIAVPTLVIAGAHDPATPPDKSEEIAAAIPDTEMVTLDAAHMSNIEAAEAFDGTLEGFLDRAR